MNALIAIAILLTTGLLVWLLMSVLRHGVSGLLRHRARCNRRRAALQDALADTYEEAMRQIPPSFVAFHAASIRRMATAEESGGVE